MTYIKPNIILKIFVILLLLNKSVFSQSNIDSLQNIIDKTIEKKGTDTTVAGLYIKLYKATFNTQPIVAIQHAANALQIYTELNDSNGIALTHRYIGDNYFQRGVYNFAMDSYTKSYDIFVSLKNQEQIAYSYIKLGQTYLSQKLDSISYEAFEKALQIFKKIESKKGMSYAYDNMAEVKLLDYNFPECYIYLDSSLNIRKELKNNQLIALSYENIANSKIYEEDYESAEEYFIKALTKYRLDNDKIKIADTYFGLGEIYFFDEIYDKALENYKKALIIYSEKKHLDKISEVNIRIGTIALENEQYENALKLAYNAQNTSLLYDYKDIRLDAYSLLIKIFESKENDKEALKYMHTYKNLRDTIISDLQNKQSAELQVNLATQKKEQEIQILQKNEQIQNAVIEKKAAEQKLLIIGLSTLALIMIVLIIFGFYLYKTNKNIKKANILLIEKNEEINQQKEEIQIQKNDIENKSKKITSSLTYAGRMQRAMLPKINEIRKKLPESFVMLSPKEAVSGDFFWHAVTKDNEGNEKILITAVDCTGHGVPGAFMSMLADAYLNQIVYQEKILSPEKILQKLHKGIFHALQQEKSFNTDGMDIAICIIDKKKKILEYAGAKNPLYYIQDNQEFLLKGDPISIGGFVKKERQYKKQTIDISKPTHFYIYSDGFQDQFGGTENKKYMAKLFRNFLFKIHTLPMNEQAVELATELDDWKGNKEQMDDIIVIGVKL